MPFDGTNFKEEETPKETKIDLKNFYKIIAVMGVVAFIMLIFDVVMVRANNSDYSNVVAVKY